MITFRQEDGIVHLHEVTVEQRVLGIPIQQVDEGADNEVRDGLRSFGFYPLWFDASYRCRIYVRGRLAWIVLKAYRKLTNIGWKIMGYIYWVGLIDPKIGERFQWKDYWRIKSQ